MTMSCRNSPMTTCLQVRIQGTKIEPVGTTCLQARIQGTKIEPVGSLDFDKHFTTFVEYDGHIVFQLAASVSGA